ncbi:MAG TPA: MBL fold metallo-hydrolase [Gammaproteobacteria bacterium]|nr:MBL fold metallo-hydrolase [Gammaproteobacteria bacterium]
MELIPFLHKSSSTWSYLVGDGASRRAAIIDPALDYDAASGRTGTASVQRVVDEVRARDWTLDWVLETHAHADHLSAAQYVKRELGGRVAIGEGIRGVQQAFKALFNLGDDFKTDGSQFDRLFRDGETFRIGALEARVMAVPGHTRDSIAYRIGDAVFTGDTLFMPDSGTARCDFPGGDAGMLYDSIHALLALPEGTRLYMCHDYGAGGREHRSETTVKEQRQGNIHVKDGISRDAYVRLRHERDATLPVPALLLPAIQVNIRAGRLPEPESNGTAYLRIPIDRF